MSVLLPCASTKRENVPQSFHDHLSLTAVSRVSCPSIGVAAEHAASASESNPKKKIRAIVCVVYERDRGQLNARRGWEYEAGSELRADDLSRPAGG